MPVNKKICTINGQTVRTIDDLYDELSRQLHFPPHFGRNLDALWDVLSTDIEGPFSIVWQNFKTSKKTTKRDFEQVINILKNLEDERDDFTLVIE